jgi:uncharacterized protein (TIGR03437 family)
MRLARRYPRLAFTEWLASAGLLFLPMLCPAQPSVGRPILFVHGICDDARSWDGTSVLQSLAPLILASSSAISSPLYPDHAIHKIYYDGQNVRQWPGGQDFLSTTSTTARLFAIDFFDGTSVGGNGAFATVDASAVAAIPNLNKADELAHAIWAITTATHVKDVIVIAHSMGGLSSRAYMEGLASPLNGTGITPYAGNVAKLVSVDSPHSGAPLADWTLFEALLNEVLNGLGVFENCILLPSVDKAELSPDSSFITTLNSSNNVNRVPAEVEIVAIQDFTVPGLISGNQTQGDDGIVSTLEQSIQNVAPGAPLYRDVRNQVGTDPRSPIGCSITSKNLPLHLLTCLSMQPDLPALIDKQIEPILYGGELTSISVNATLDGKPWSGSLSYSLSGTSVIQSPVTLTSPAVPSVFYDHDPMGDTVSPGEYSFSYLGGGPSSNYTISPAEEQHLGSIPNTGQNTWNLTFSIAFTSLTSQTITFGPSNNVALGVAPFTISATATSGLPVSFTSSTQTVCAVSGSTVTILAIGTCSITASQPGNANYSAAAPVVQSFSVTAAVGPSVQQGGIVNSANYGPLSPGALATIFGTNLATTSVTAATIPLPTMLESVQVSINGTYAPLWFVNQTQINFQVPWETPAGNASIVVTSGGISSGTATVPVLSVSPALFVTGGDPSVSQNQALVQNSDYSLNGPNNPAPVGSTIIAYVSGAGAVTPPVPTGAPAPISGPLSWLTLPYSATIWPGTATVTFAGLLPSLVGITEMNIVVPSGLPTGNYLLSVSVGGQTSNANTISVMGSATPSCAPFPAGFVPFTSVYYVSKTDSAGDRLLVGAINQPIPVPNWGEIGALPLPAAPNQEYCGLVTLADGYDVTAYVPTAAEKSGNFSAFSGLLVDPHTNSPFPHGVFPNGVIPTFYLPPAMPNVFAWRIAGNSPIPSVRVEK